jgi:hypothetical protein
LPEGWDIFDGVSVGGPAGEDLTLFGHRQPRVTKDVVRVAKSGF